MNSIILSAPAKVNLFLKVLKKRKDGYHDLHTLFERISLADIIKISKIPKGIKVSSNKLITADPKDNIVYKAAQAILGYAGSNRGVRIKINKRIPIAAGLGGGSSDAASVLMGINTLYGLKLKRSELIVIGRKLGADVPFFLLDTPFAVGSGKGDKLKTIPVKARLWHLIVNPGLKLATKDIYDSYDRSRLTTPGGDVRIGRSLTGSFDIKSLEKMLYNDLERIAIAEESVLGCIIERLAYHLGKKAIVSGSGPSVFCLYGTGKEAESAKKRLFRSVPAPERKLWRVFVASTAT